MFNLVYQLHKNKKVNAILVERIQVVSGEDDNLVYINLDKFDNDKWYLECDWITIDGRSIFCEAIRKQLNP